MFDDIASGLKESREGATMSGGQGSEPSALIRLSTAPAAAAEPVQMAAAAPAAPSTPPAEEWRASWAATLPRLAQISR